MVVTGGSATPSPSASGQTFPETWIETALRLLAEPTAPFHEQNVIAAVLAEADRLGLESRVDRFGNVLVELNAAEASGRALPLLITAHMDHPGFWAQRMLGPGRLLASWVGRVPRGLFEGASVRFYCGGGTSTQLPLPHGDSGGAAEAGFALAGTPVEGRVREVQAYEGEGDWARVELEVEGEVQPGSIGQWSLPPAELDGDFLRATAVDDVAGVASLLCVMQAFAAAQRSGGALPERRVTLLFTRAEEAGFVGCTEFCRERVAQGLAGTAQVVGVEMSMASADAPLGEGVVVRVGDRRNVFDPATTDHLTRVAQQLAESVPGFAYQRKLMSGGTCESSVFQRYLGRSGAVCLPLANYHNHHAGTRPGGLEREAIHRQDFVGLVRLLIALTLESPSADDAAGTDTAWFEDLSDRQAGLLFDAAGDPEGRPL
ncbi:MAG: M20/M25/M40 family metallo-hydrolase [Planctomycetota bacterium]